MSFFETAPWNQIPRDRVGISSVKKLFDKLLREITRKSFNDVVHDIESSIQERRSEIDRIGPARGDTAARRMYLLQIAAEFQALTNTAMLSSYGYGTCFEDKDMRLTSLIIASSEKFADVMAKKSFTRSFKGNQTVIRTDSTENISTTSSVHSLHETYQANDSDSSNESSDDILTPGLEKEDNIEFQELNLVAGLCKAQANYSTEDIILWIKHEFQNHRCLGIGGLNPSLYKNLFERQTLPWATLAKAHVSETVINVHRFLHKLLAFVCKDPAVRDNIWSRMIPTLVQIYNDVLKHVDFLLQVEQKGNLGTLNHYLADNIRKSNEARTLLRLKELGTYSSASSGSQTLLRLTDVTKACQSNEDHAIQDIHDTLKSYCKVARKRFVDNLYMQVIDCLLITSDGSPLNVLSSSWVGSLSDVDLAQIAGETESIRKRRDVLQEEIKSFEKGLVILRS